MLSGNHGADTPKIQTHYTDSIGKRNRSATVVSDPLIGGSAPTDRLYPSQSQRPQNAARLAQEVALHWAKPEAQAPPWLRESFRRRRPTTSSLWAFTTDTAGRIVRAFTADAASIAAYAQLRREDCGTCPIEAVWPPTIAPGQPAEPAHLYLQEQGVEL